MKLANALGLVEMENVPDEAKEIMQEAAERFLMAGGSLDLQTWLDLSESEREAFERAFDRIETARILRFCGCLLDPDQRAETALALDGGGLSDHLALEGAVEGVCAGFRAETERLTGEFGP